MTNAIDDTVTTERNPSIKWSHVLWIILATILLTVGATYWVVRTYIYAKDFKPVVLEQKESVVLDQKLKQLGYSAEADSTAENKTRSSQPGDFNNNGDLIPERYSESGATREVSLTERELNSLLANNTELARKLAIDLSDNLMSAKLLLPVDQDFPLLGGKTLRVTAGLEVAYQNDKPIVILKGVSIMGLPLPNSWLGGMKNIDMVKEFGAGNGFWKAFADGVENIHVEDGYLVIKLKE